MGTVSLALALIIGHCAPRSDHTKRETCERISLLLFEKSSWKREQTKGLVKFQFTSRLGREEVARLNPFVYTWLSIALILNGTEVPLPNKSSLTIRRPTQVRRSTCMAKSHHASSTVSHSRYSYFLLIVSSSNSRFLVWNFVFVSVFFVLMAPPMRKLYFLLTDLKSSVWRFLWATRPKKRLVSTKTRQI